MEKKTDFRYREDKKALYTYSIGCPSTIWAVPPSRVPEASPRVIALATPKKFVQSTETQFVAIIIVAHWNV